MPTELPYIIVDAFTTTAFAGNPAAVVLLPNDTAIADETLQLIAREFNLAETAFVSPTSDAKVYNLRWFTPAFEMPLCGHATLASAHVLGLPGDVTFKTRLSGDLLTSRREDGTIEMSFPAGVPEAVSEDLKRATVEVVRKILRLAAAPEITFVGSAPGPSFKGYLLVHIDDEIDLENATVQPEAVAELPKPYWLIILTNTPPARLSETGVRFVSRVFVPPPDVTEDPVTGSAHCMLAPYWTQKLGDQEALRAKQVSPRGGDLQVEWLKDSGRTALRGRAVTVAKGTLFVPKLPGAESG